MIFGLSVRSRTHCTRSRDTGTRPRACTHDHACCHYGIRITTGAAAGMRAGSVRSRTRCIRLYGTGTRSHAHVHTITHAVAMTSGSPQERPPVCVPDPSDHGRAASGHTVPVRGPTRTRIRSHMLPLWYPDHHRSGRRYACRIRQITDALHQVIRYRYEVPRACTHDHACCRYDIRITTGAAAGMRAGSVRSWTHCIRPRGTHQITDALHRSRSTSAVPPRQGTTTTTS